MGKRSNFERIERDFYPTPEAAVIPLLPHIQSGQKFVEPCAGDGALIDSLVSLGGLNCVGAFDIDPRRDGITTMDAINSTYSWRLLGADIIITNPPWNRKVLHPMINHFSALCPTWLLFDADWMHTRQSTPFMPWLRKIVSVGRIKWIPDSKMTGKDNCAWYLFDRSPPRTPTEFWGRT